MFKQKRQRKDEEWDDIVRDRLKQQREARGAKVRYQQLRQEIADLAISYIDQGLAERWMKLEDKVKALRALERQYPSVKELT
jgi:hypothetical protein